MIERTLRKVIVSRLKTFPAVALLGPRQSGKTTLARTFSSIYYDLELDSEKLRLDLEWENIARSERLIILDEAQNYPEILPRIKNLIDQKRSRNGRFLILGSVAPGLMKQVSEFLTGRISLCELSPFSLLEVEGKKEDHLWLMGGFPDGGILKKGQFPIWQKNYLDLLAMRDLPLWGLPASPPVTQRFFKMVAAVHGTIWNASQIGKSMGLSYHTVNNYLNYLEQVYLIRRLPPFFTNVKKRLVKSPKVYWRDTGLLHSLMGVSRNEDLLIQPWVGASWEGWAIEQILIFLQARGQAFEAGYFRTNDGYELDLVLQLKGKRWAFKIKLTSSPGKNDLERLKKSGAMVTADKMFLVSRSSQEVMGKETIATNVKGVLRILGE